MESWSNVRRNYRNSRRNSCRGDTAVHRSSALLLSTPGTNTGLKLRTLASKGQKKVAKRHLKTGRFGGGAGSDYLLYQFKQTDKGAELCC